MKQPAKNTLRMEVRIDPGLRHNVAICSLMDGKSDSEWIRDALARYSARRLGRASDKQYRAAVAKLKAASQ